MLALLLLRQLHVLFQVIDLEQQCMQQLAEPVMCSVKLQLLLLLLLPRQQQHIALAGLP
jgi:hypothetical protein